MWRILAACLLVTSLVGAHHDGTDHEHEHKALILLEIEPTANSTAKDKRSPQHGAGQARAVFGASPGQFVVHSEESQPEVPPEYLSLLQQLVSQQHQEGGSEAQQPVIQQLLVARNPDPSAVQFTSSPGQAPPRRPPPSPQAQLQQLYFNSQFQQQIPLRPRVLRPRPRPQAPSQDDFPGLAPSSQAYGIHEARLRASLAGSDPNLAIQQQAFPSTASPSLYDQQLTQFATASQEQLVQLQAAPQQQVRQQAQQQASYSIVPQVRYAQQPSQRSLSYSRQSAPSQQLVSSERAKPARRPSQAPQQYLRETTQPLPQQTLVQVPQRQQTSDPSVYLGSESGRQTPSTSQDDDIIAQLLGQQGRGLFPGSSPTASSVAEEVVRSTTALPPTASRSSIYVTQTANVKNDQGQNKITIEDVGTPQEQSGTTLPVVHLPTPDGQRPLTQSEFKALVDAGFNISPVPVSSQETGITQTVSPEYYRPTTKKQRSYVTPAPPRNQVYQSRQKQQQQREQNQAAESPEVQNVQQRGHVTRFQIHQTKPQEEEELVQYVSRPVPEEAQTVRQTTQVTRLEYITEKPDADPEEETIQFFRLPTTPEVEDARQRANLAGYNPDAGRAQQPTQFHRYQQERQNLAQVQNTRYQPQTTENEEQRYQTEAISLQQQTPSYRDEQQSVARDIQRFHHPIIVAELPTTTPVPSPTPRRRRPRPSHSRIVYRAYANPEDQEKKQEQPTQFLISYDTDSVDNVPEATNFGTRNSRVRGRRPSPTDES